MLANKHSGGVRAADGDRTRDLMNGNHLFYQTELPLLVLREGIEPSHATLSESCLNHLATEA